MKKSIMSTATQTATATTITKPQPRVRAQATPPRMNTTTLTIGLDLGDKVSDYCVLSAAGEVIEEGRVKTTRDAFTARFAALPAVRLALETGTHSNWAAQHLSEMGHEVLVANARGKRRDKLL